MNATTNPCKDKSLSETTSNNYSFESFEKFMDWLTYFTDQTYQQYCVYSYRKNQILENEFTYVHYKCIHHNYPVFKLDGTNSRAICPAKIKVTHLKK